MKNILVVLICTMTLTAFAQGGKLKKANNYFDKLAYSYAAKLYEELKGSTMDSPEMQLKLAYSYMKMEQFQKSADVYSKAITSNGVKAEDCYNYAYTLKQLGNYTESDKWMKTYTEQKAADSRSKLFLEDEGYKSRIENLKPFFKVEHLDINTVQADFGGYYSPSQTEMYFLSARRRRVMVQNEWAWNANRFLDIFKVEVKDGNKVENVTKVKKVNTRFHEGSLAFSPDNKIVYFTRNNITSGKNRKDGKRIQNLKLYIAEINEKGKWVKEKEFPYNSKDYSIGHPTISADGKTMYLSSDKPGGFGGADIYKVAINADGTFGEMINLGAKINTEGQEMFPFIDSEGRLFFATDGMPGLGGLDVFVAIYKGDEITKVTNLGTPVNTKNDDFAFTMSKDFKYGFLSSNRDGGDGGDDIYSVQLIRPFVFSITIQGTAKDKKGNIVPFAKIDLKDDKGNVIASKNADENGFYAFEAEYDKNYALLGTKEKYFDGANKASTFTKEEVVTADVILEKDPGISIYALVTDKKTGLPLEGVKINFADNFTGKAINITTPESGDFKRALPDKKINDRGSYNLVLQKEGYFTKTITYNQLFDREGQYDVHGVLDMTLEPEVKDLRDLVQINPINFDLDKFNIRPDAAKELDKVVEVMNRYPNMVVELGSHTDCRASKAYNEKLSSNRAKASAEYIKKRITNPERIYGKGYGESRLLNDCACEGNVKSDCSEEEHEKNRRTEFKVISTGDNKVKVVNTSSDSFD
ncbi:MAG TPA: OmpA family protein [Crocinitomicaceae bacterium]|nr:OmpA family protein [Crocinitomicaceae bacterium]